MNYDKEFLKVRKAANRFLGSEAVKKYQEMQIVHAHSCLASLIEHPGRYIEDFRE